MLLLISKMVDFSEIGYEFTSKMAVIYQAILDRW